MPLTKDDRRFLQSIDRFKAYLLIIAGAVLLVLLLTPQSEIQFVTSIIGFALCGVFWLTQRLLSYITVLDIELSRIAETLKRIVPEEQQRELKQPRSR